MATDHIVAALDELLEERSNVGSRVRELQRQLEVAASQLQRLDSAIASLREVRGISSADISSPDQVAIEYHYPDDYSRATTLEPDGPNPYSVPALPDLPPGPERIDYFIDNKGLQSAHMVASVVDAIGEPVSRDVLHRLFFEYFGREELSKHWSRLDKAFNSALQRAIQKDMILQFQAEPSEQMFYMSGTRIQPQPRSPVFDRVLRRS